MATIDHTEQTSRGLPPVEQSLTDHRFNPGQSPIKHDPVMVVSENLDLEPEAQSSHCLRLCCGFDLRRTIIAFRRKYFPWTFSSSVIVLTTSCVAMCFAVLIGIVIVCVTAAKRPGMCCCNAEIVLGRSSICRARTYEQGIRFRCMHVPGVSGKNKCL